MLGLHFPPRVARASTVQLRSPLPLRALGWAAPRHHVQHASQAGRSMAVPALPEDSSMRRSKPGDSFIETAIRQELGMQSNRLADDVRERVVKAIQTQRYRTTVGEVAAQAGLKLTEAEAALKALAFDSQAVLQVSSEGDVVYVFGTDLENAIRSKSFSLQAKPFLTRAQTALAFLVRITFGTALFASIAVTFLAVAVVLNGRNDDRRNKGSSSGYGGMGMRMHMMPDLWWYWNPSYSRPHSSGQDSEMSLPEAIFSFVFGDGDPNKGYDESRWRALGRFIQSRNGVVASEEMAPFLDCPRGPGSGSSSTDEAYVLPALIKFGGEPFVDEGGHLLYRFPSLQKTVVQREFWGWRSKQTAGQDVPSVQYEESWELTAASPGQLVAIVGLGILNIVGVSTLRSLLVDPYSKAYLVSQGLGWIAAALPALFAYAVAFFALPALRFIRNMLINRAINERNDAREQAALQLASPSRQLAMKLGSARKLGEKKLITKRDIVFTTEQDSGPQRNAQEMADWDRRMGSKQDSRDGRSSAGSAGW